MTPPCLLIAGTHSGVGKTTVALAVMAALRRRGLVVQPFKVGPDFIDPGHHQVVCGRTSRNLDTWMLDDDAVRRTVANATQGADVAVIEGVMGLFDGRGPDDQRGSSADVARVLGIPVVLVVDAAGMGGSVAALVRGFAEFDSSVRVVGVVCNRVASGRHFSILEVALRCGTAVEPLGWLPRDPTWAIPSRHLGLTTAADFTTDHRQWDRLVTAVAETVDLDRMFALAAPAAPSSDVVVPQVLRPVGARVWRVAVAQDAVFCFYYAENVELLEAAGAEVVRFSPLTSAALPPGTDLVYLGGGYPELHAAQLAANGSMLASLRAFHAGGGAMYAECGGLMYACRELVDAAGVAYPMLDLLPARTVMQTRRVELGYVTWRAERTSPLGPAGTEVRGHEFHYSRIEPLSDLRPVAALHRNDEQSRPDGYVNGGLLAGYAHLHFGSNPAVVEVLLNQFHRSRCKSDG